ncbi:hypothetical protein [Desulfotalea psychrophila]|uniref:YkgJ family cysteine cluster protein n=1 Tax=Desulfotalea psychrophila (strain LSv54 / DSM 12343) TaxID=177439 RepID=Q6AQU6_DESPS|nr:hypothetical protein [Desulfotalea psychrophila]CAG35277.1 unknown protein [Desulfotalea psychrophila LSv54]
MKEKTLQAIYQTFNQWNDGEKSCHRGCSTCCTQNITVTATEAELIHKFAVEEDKQEWLAEILSAKRDLEKPKMTTNDFAKACLEGRDVDPGTMGLPCPLPIPQREHLPNLLGTPLCLPCLCLKFTLQSE